MPVNAMKRLTVIAPAKDTDLLLRRLMHLGCTELTDRPADEEALCGYEAPASDREAIAERLSHITRVLPVLEAHSGKRRNNLREIDYSTFLSTDIAIHAERTVSEAEKLLTFMESTEKTEKEECALMDALVPFLDFPYALDELGTKTAKILLGSIPQGESVATLTDAADTAGFAVYPLSTDKNGTHFAAITHRDGEAEAREVLARFRFTEACFTVTDGRPVTLFDAAQKRAAKCENDLKQANRRLEVLAENYGEVSALADVLAVNEQTAALKEKLFSLGSCTVLTAWCPAFEVPRIARVLDGMTVAYDFADPAVTEKPPRPAAEPPYMGKGATLFGLYRTPWHGKWNAAIPLTVFYALLFGLLFADAGYGICAALTAVLLLLPKRVPKRLKQAAPLLLCCGASLLLFGILLGRYFDTALLVLLQKDTVSEIAPFPALAAALAACRTALLRFKILLAVALLPALTYLITIVTLRIVALSRAHRAAEIPLSVGPHLCFFAGLGLFFLHPLVAGIVLAAALLFVVIMGIVAGTEKKARLIAMGGSLLDLLSELTLALCAARTALLALAAALCLWPITGLAPTKSHAFPGLVAMLLTFAIAHALQLLLNAAPALVGRAKLCYMERFDVYYPGRAILFRPLRSVGRYTRDLSAKNSDEEKTATTYGKAEPLSEASSHDEQ